MPQCHARCIDDELAACNLKDILVTTFGADNVQYGERTIARIRNKLGWTYSTAKYCQAIQDVNKQKRLDWCVNLIAKKEKFDGVIFTDESTFQLDAIEGSASVRRCPESSSTSTSIRQRYMCGLAYRREVPLKL